MIIIVLTYPSLSFHNLLAASYVWTLNLVFIQFWKRLERVGAEIASFSRSLSDRSKDCCIQVWTCSYYWVSSLIASVIKIVLFVVYTEWRSQARYLWLWKTAESRTLTSELLYSLFSNTTIKTRSGSGKVMLFCSSFSLTKYLLYVLLNIFTTFHLLSKTILL